MASTTSVDEEVELPSVGDHVPLAGSQELTSELSGSVSQSRREILGHSFNLANSTIGAGVLGLPYVVRECGIALTVLMLVAAALLTDYTLVLLVRCYYAVNGEDKGYEQLGQRCYGRAGVLGVALGSFLINFGALVVAHRFCDRCPAKARNANVRTQSYEIIVADLLVPVLGHYTGAHAVLSNRVLVGALLVFGVMLPLSLPRQMSSMKAIAVQRHVVVVAVSLIRACRQYLSAISVAFVVAFIVMIIAKSTQCACVCVAAVVCACVRCPLCDGRPQWG